MTQGCNSAKWFPFSLAALAVLTMMPCVSLAFWQVLSSDGAQKLETGTPIERQIKAGDVQQYEITLRERQVLFVELDEWGFDAKVELLKATDNKTLVTANLGTGMERETLTFLAEQTAGYLVRVSAGEHESGRGRYHLTARLTGLATEKERTRIKAEQLLTEAAALNKEGSPDKIREAIGKREQALPLWRSLGDRYWESHTLARLADAYKALLNYVKALAYFNQSLEITREFGDKKIEAVRLIELGATTAVAGERQKANEHYDQASQLFKATDNKLGVAISLYWLGDNANQLGDKPKALDYFNQALLLTREEQNKNWEATVLYGLGLVANAQNEKLKALDLYNQALALWRAAKYEAGEGVALLNIGKVYVSQGEAQKALDVLNQALLLFRNAKNKWQEAATFSEISNAYQRLGKVEDSIESHKQALAIYLELKFKVVEISFLGLIATQLNGVGKYAEAIKYAEMALATEEAVPEGTAEAQRKKYEHGMRQSNAYSLSTMGQAYYNLGDRDKALLYYGQALAWFEKDEEKDSRLNAVSILDAIAQVNANKYEWDKALENYNRALNLSKELDSKANIAQELNSLGLIYSSTNEKRKALEYFEQSLVVNRSIPDRSKFQKRLEASALGNIGGIYLFLGEPKKSLEYEDQSLEVYKSINAPMFIDEMSTTYGNIGNVHRLLGNNQKALEMYSQARELFRQAPPQIKSLARNRTKDANLLSSIASVHSDLGDTQQALDLYNQVLKMTIDADDKALEARTRNNIGLIYSFFAENQKALDFLNQALSFFKAIKNKNEEATVLNNIGRIYSELGENQRALECYEQVLPICRGLGNRQGEAIALNNIGLIRSVFGEKQTALEYFNQALSIYRAINGKSSEATTLNNVGMGYAELGENKKALEYMNQALAIFKEIGSKDGEATTLDNLGSICSGLGEYRKALEYHSQALPIRRAIGDKHGEASTLNNLGTNYSELGEKRKALDYYSQSLLISRAGGNRRGEAGTLNNMGSVYRDLGEKKKALAYFNQALSLRRAVGDRSGEATTLNSIGTVYLSLRENEKASDNFNAALEIARQIGDKGSVASYLNNLAILYSDTGERGKALEFYDQALALDRAIGSKSGEATILDNMAWDHLELGENQKALEYREMCLLLSRETGAKREEIISLMGIGSIYREWGEQEKSPDRFKQALAYYEQSIRLSRQAENKDTEASALSGIGRVFTEMGETDKALQNLTSALELARNYQDPLLEGAIHTALGKLFEKNRALDKATSEYQQTVVIARAIGDKDSEAKALKGLMSVWQARGNTQLAVLYGKQAVNKYQELRSAIRTLQRKTQDVYREKVTDAYRELANLLIERDRLPEAEQVLALLKEAEFRQLQVNRSSAGPDTIPYSKAEANVMAKIESLTALENERAELLKEDLPTESTQSRRDQIANEIKTANDAFVAALTALKISEASIKVKERITEIENQKVLQSALQALEKEAQTGLVALYTVLGTEEKNPANKASKAGIKFGWVILVHSGNPAWHKAYPIDVANLGQLVSQFRKALSSDQFDAQPLAEKIYNAIFRQTSRKQRTTLEADLERLLGAYKNKTLMWSLDGVLRYVPIAALHDGKGYLVEKYSNVVFTNASMVNLKDKDAAKWTALGLGVSDAQTVVLPGKAGIGFTPLIGTQRELQDIVHEPQSSTGILDGTIKLNKEFTKDATLRLLRRGVFQVVHIASHYSFNPADQTASFLVLGDGFLTLGELRSNENLFGTVDLLTLSACDTAMGSENGEEAEGFASLAQDLGAKSVVASLWKVPDEGTPELMIRFYKLRAENFNMSKGEAFRQAQLSLLGSETTDQQKTSIVRSARVVDPSDRRIELPLFVKDAKRPFSHPHYWASFVLIGNWR